MKLYLDTEINLIVDANGQEVKKLSEAEANLLIEFIKNRGKCLSREELMQAGWPTAIVVENSLNMAIRKLRLTGINIETVARKGYALVDDRIDIERKLSVDIASSSNVPDTVTVSSQLNNEDQNSDLFINELGSDSGQQLLEAQRVDDGLKKTTHSKILYWFFFSYFFLLCLIYILLEGAKPDIKCFENFNTKVCTTYGSFDELKIKDLEPGFYIYGKTYDENDEYRFIRIDN
ncbi:winged helix-turn-helix domain-containing protein [Vibrio cholerae]|nr:winged helix-turn-helix domain-containing protein [Vibrio cholerae]ELV3250093.1 winged helix-turn-helix domain-containing protein [Vibrio cholerae]